SELPEDLMLGAVLYAHQEMQTVIQVIDELVRDAGKPRWEVAPPADDSALLDAMKELIGAQIDDAYRIVDKQQRVARLDALRNQALQALTGDVGYGADAVRDVYKKLEKKIVRSRIIHGEPRIDGRDGKTVRP